MKAKTLKAFFDLSAKKRRKSGVVFEVSNSRFEEINSTKHGKLVERVPEKSEKKVEKQSGFPKHTGGGWYELSNGDRVQGKDNAMNSEKELK